VSAAPVRIESVTRGRYTLTPGRCGTCGQRFPAWTPEAMIAAAQSEYERTGFAPRPWSWRRATPEHPAEANVRRVFGHFRNLLTAAGLEPRFARRTGSSWLREDVIAAMLDWVLARGEWPKMRDWSRSEDGHPHYMTALRFFGNWTNAKRAAGWLDPDEAIVESAKYEHKLRRAADRRRKNYVPKNQRAPLALVGRNGTRQTREDPT